MHAFDRRTDERTDRNLIARPRLHSIQRGKGYCGSKASHIPSFSPLIPSFSHMLCPSFSLTRSPSYVEFILYVLTLYVGVQYVWHCPDGFLTVEVITIIKSAPIFGRASGVLAQVRCLGTSMWPTTGLTYNKRLFLFCNDCAKELHYFLWTLNST